MATLKKNDLVRELNKELAELPRGASLRLRHEEFAALTPDEIKALARAHGLRCTYDAARPGQLFAPGGAAFWHEGCEPK
jgi:hypothetical protein